MTISWQQWIQGFAPTDAAGPPDQWPFQQSAEFLEQKLGHEWLEAEFAPTKEDQKAAWEFYTQLRSRITTRPLHYLDGDEKTALNSVYKLFQFARDTCTDNTHECKRFSDLVWVLLNEAVRAFTAKWHRPFIDDGNLNEDQRHSFREELIPLQQKLKYFLALFEALSQADAIKAPVDTEQSESGQTSTESFPFSRILFSPSVDKETATLIHKAECKALNERRGCAEDAPVADTAGLALSGGGLRSATFALGALQGLAKNNVLPNFDYLSTVSGGGYAGSFLSCILNSEVQTTPPVGLTAGDLPFARSHAQESAPMRHLRASSKALLTGGFWKRLEIPVLAIAGWIASIFVAIPPIIILTLALCLTNHYAIERSFQQVAAMASDSEVVPQLYAYGCWQYILVISVAVVLLVGLWLMMAKQQIDRRAGNTQLPEAEIKAIGILLLAFCGLLLWLCYPYIVTVVSRISNSLGALPIPSEGVLAALAAAAVPLFSRMASETSKTSKLKPLLDSIALALSPIVFVGMIAILITKYILFPGGDFSLINAALLTVATIAVFVLAHILMNINACSLHPFYRDRLARAYHLTMVDDAKVKPSTPQKLSKLREHNRSGPYHLINAALNAPNGHNDALRGRIADFFLFSSEYCGSETTGYKPTTQFEAADRSVDLATAIAISGAAASPFMGVNVSRTNFWAALLNIRLDYWLRVPGRKKSHWDGRPGPSNWLRQYTGNVTDKTAFVNLSDGGHIENMAMYELLRRRCRYIVVVDGECDPGITCGSFLQVIRYAKIDFGIHINIDLSRLKHASVRSQTDSGAAVSAVPKGENASPTVDFHFALGQIHYPPCKGESQPPPVGLVLYLKSSMSGNESKPLQSYRERNPSFPHQTTGDLAYDEEQFEAYRALGQHIVEDAFRSELVGSTPPGDIGGWLQAMNERLNRS